MLPRITVVTPSFNQAETLEATLRSVLDQEYPNLEYIVVDGGSTDGSAAILERYSSRLSWWVSEPDHGHGHAINKGFARATGEIMGWINSDDLLLPGSLSLVGRLFARFPAMEWLSSPGAVLDPDGSIVQTLTPWPWTRERFLVTVNRFVQQESTFWRRTLWTRAGAHVSEDLISCDHELWARFFRHARLFQTAGLIGAFRHQRGQRSVRQRDRYLAEARATLARERAASAEVTIPERDAEIYSEIRFNANLWDFERHDALDLFAVTDSSFFNVDVALVADLSILAIETPPWGIERNVDIRQLLPELARRQPMFVDFLWLGSGERQGLRLHLRSWVTCAVELRWTTAPGPSRPDAKRTLSVVRRSEGGLEERRRLEVEREESLAGRFVFAPGRHELTFSVLEEATIRQLANGDTRPLLAAIAGIELVRVDAR